MSQQKRFSACLWFDGQAGAAAEFYTSVFPGSEMGRIARYGKEGFEFHHQPEGSVMTAGFRLAGMDFLALNGGPVFTLNPSISFFVVLETGEETDALWQALSEGGKVLMPLDKYEWSPKYGWVEDKFGVSWQVSKGKRSDTGGHTITPALMFTKEKLGHAAEAVHFYTSVFRDGIVRGVLKHGPGTPHEGLVIQAQFSIEGKEFMVMDGPGAHDFTFNEAISLVLYCDTQEEIDHYWNRLTEDGEESQCGWLRDKFGVSWQIVPEQLGEMMSSPDQEKVARVTNAFLQMKKFDIEKLRAAYEGI